MWAKCTTLEVIFHTVKENGGAKQILHTTDVHHLHDVVLTSQINDAGKNGLLDT